MIFYRSCDIYIYVYIELQIAPKRTLRIYKQTTYKIDCELECMFFTSVYFRGSMGLWV